MKILTVNFSDTVGGAARAAYRLHTALLKEGVSSQMLVQKKSTDDHTVIGPLTRLQALLAILLPTIETIPIGLYKNRANTVFSTSWTPMSNIVQRINALNPDIVHLHWIGGGMMRIEHMAEIKVPIVWSLHDNWAYTGGCHVKWKCERYKNHCGACPQLASQFNYDLSRWVYSRKQKSYSKISNLTLIGLSRWAMESAKESSLFKDKKLVNIPNPLNTETFKPYDKELARCLWNLPLTKKLVLFGAHKAISDQNKGFAQLIEALRSMKRKDFELVIFGSGEPVNSCFHGFNTHYLGRLCDDISLTTLYNACDVTVVPSLQENLSYAIMESLSCGTPVVAFNTGGNNDLIEHRSNGYLANPFNTEDLAKGIDWVLNLTNYDVISQSARKKIIQEFDSRQVVKKYIELYEEILKLHCKTV